MAKKAVKAPTKTQIIATIAERTELSKKEVTAVFEALSDEIRKSLGRNGAGVFTIPGLVKISKKKVPAKPAEKNVLNRFTGEYYDRPAKPASTKVTVRALKGLKDMG